MRRAFTLIELIVVIIIVGILGAVGVTQYTKVVERGRQAEARMILGEMRTFAYQYRLENGVITGMTDADVHIGTASDQIPDACRSTHYFYYNVDNATETQTQLVARRCASGGKTPSHTYYTLYNEINFVTGTETYHGY